MHGDGQEASRHRRRRGAHDVRCERDHGQGVDIFDFVGNDDVNHAHSRTERAELSRALRRRAQRSRIPLQRRKRRRARTVLGAVEQARVVAFDHRCVRPQPQRRVLARNLSHHRRRAASRAFARRLPRAHRVRAILPSPRVRLKRRRAPPLHALLHRARPIFPSHVQPIPLIPRPDPPPRRRRRRLARPARPPPLVVSPSHPALRPRPRRRRASHRIPSAHRRARRDRQRLRVAQRRGERRRPRARRRPPRPRPPTIPPSLVAPVRARARARRSTRRRRRRVRDPRRDVRASIRRRARRRARRRRVVVARAARVVARASRVARGRVHC